MLHSPSINNLRMVVKRSLVLLVCACIISLPHVLLAEESFKALKIGSVPPGTMAAPFELQSLEGKSVPMRQFAGKLVVLNFWATWCGPCKEEMPALERLRQKLDPERASAAHGHDGFATGGDQAFSREPGRASSCAVR